MTKKLETNGYKHCAPTSADTEGHRQCTRAETEGHKQTRKYRVYANRDVNVITQLLKFTLALSVTDVGQFYCLVKLGDIIILTKYLQELQVFIELVIFCKK